MEDGEGRKEGGWRMGRVEDGEGRKEGRKEGGWRTGREERREGGGRGGKKGGRAEMCVEEFLHPKQFQECLNNVL